MQGKRRELLAAGIFAFIMATGAPAISCAGDGTGFCGRAMSKTGGSLFESLQRHQEPNYLTLSPHYAGAVFGNDARSSEVLFEAQLSHAFHVFDLSCISTLTDGALEGFMTFNPKIVLRMYRGTSVPVKTPSYMPDMTWYLWSRSWLTEKGGWFTAFRVGHHSNGQSGPFMVAGRVNTDTGNFSTNYWQFAIHHYEERDERILWPSLAFTSHWGSANGFLSREPNLEGQYEKQKLTADIRSWWRLGTYSEGCHGLLCGLTPEILGASLKVEYILKGKDFVIKPAVPASFGDKWNISVGLTLKIKALDDVRLFAKYDYGYDYYNIHFQERINRLMFGIAGTIGGPQKRDANLKPL